MRYRKDFIMKQNSSNEGFDLGGIGALGGWPQSSVDSMTELISADIHRRILESMREEYIGDNARDVIEEHAINTFQSDFDRELLEIMRDIAVNGDVTPSNNTFINNDDTFNNQRSYLQEQLNNLIGQLEASGRTNNITMPIVNRIPGSVIPTSVPRLDNEI